MTVLTILEVPDPGLRAVAAPVAEIDDTIRATLADMFETMYAARGIGLAATQVGIEKRLVVIDLQEPEEEGGEAVRKPVAFVNPELLWKSEETAPYEEGCLSVPEIYDEVERPSQVKLRYLNYAGETIEEDAEGLFAVCIQHEMDHLDGVLFIDHLSRLKREQAIKKVKKQAKAA